MTRPRALYARSRKFARDAFVIVAFLSTALAQPLEAQRASSIQLGVTTHTALAVTSASKQAPEDTTSKRGRYTLRGALIGTGIGAAAGFIAADASTRGNYTDHSEDGLLYLFFPVSGAVIGMLLGGVLGYVWN
jgi:NhaP-type Na+/H+ or K+/H+ antiporter